MNCWRAPKEAGSTQRVDPQAAVDSREHRVGASGRAARPSLPLGEPQDVVELLQPLLRVFVVAVDAKQIARGRVRPRHPAAWVSAPGGTAMIPAQSTRPRLASRDAGAGFRLRWRRQNGRPSGDA